MKKSKQGIITFKVDKPMMEAMKGVSNRSEFIRKAILASLESVCPLCKGTGILSPKQKVHWDRFSVDHAVQECENCRTFNLVCLHQDKGDLGKQSSHRAGGC